MFPHLSLTTRSCQTLLLNIRNYFELFLATTSEEPKLQASTFHPVGTPSLPTPFIATTSNFVYASVAVESRIAILNAETIRHLAPYPCHNKPRNQPTNRHIRISERRDTHDYPPSNINLVAFLVFSKSKRIFLFVSQRDWQHTHLSVSFP